MKAHIFDMDGLLIDSEPFWREAEVEVFTHYDIPFTEAMCYQTVGMRIDEVVAFWKAKYQMNAWNENSIIEDIQQRMIELIRSKGKALPGVYDTLKLLQENKRKCALASSSCSQLIKVVVDTLRLNDFFDHLVSAEHEEYGKPNPAVFLTAAKKLEAYPSNCIVYEDSQKGMQAGLKAGMKVVVIPERIDLDLSWQKEAHLLLASLDDFALEEIEGL